MTLYILRHARTLASEHEAARLFQALGEKQVQVYGLLTRDPAQIAHMVAALPARQPHTLSFEGGTLSATSREALGRLAQATYQYLDVRSQNANLRCWPKLHSWLHARGDREALARALGTAVPADTFAVGEIRGTLHSDGRQYPIDIETRTPQPAWRLFDALSIDALDRGFIMATQPDSHPHLLRLLSEIGAAITFDAVVPTDTASALTASSGGATCSWQAGGAMIQFPSGAIEGSLNSSNNSDRNRAKWHERIDKALRKAGL